MFNNPITGHLKKPLGIILLILLYPLLNKFLIYIKGPAAVGASLFPLLFLIAIFQRKTSIFLITSICVIFSLEAFGFHLTKIRGISFQNIVLITSLLVLIATNLKRENRLFLKSPLQLPMMLIVFYTFFSMIFTYMLGQYTRSFIGLLGDFKAYFNPFIVFLITYNLLRSKKETKITIYILVAFFITQIALHTLAYYGIADFIKYEISNKIVSGMYQPGYRVQGLLHQPNIFALFLVLFLPSMIGSITYSKVLIFKLFLFVSTFFTFMILALTGSRGGYAGAIVSLLVFVIIAKRIKMLNIGRLFSLTIVVLIILFALSYFFHDLFIANVLNRVDYARHDNIEAYSAGRLDMWRLAIDSFLEHPLFGVGWRNFFNPHNRFLLYLVTLGIAGFGLYMSLYFRMLSFVIKNSKNTMSTFGKYINTSFISGACGVFAGMCFGDALSVRLFLFLYAGVVIRYNMLKEGES